MTIEIPDWVEQAHPQRRERWIARTPIGPSPGNMAPPTLCTFEGCEVRVRFVDVHCDLHASALAVVAAWAEEVGYTD
jgi:hypothetical protein